MSRILTDVLARRLDEDIALVEEMLALIPAGREEWRPAWPKASSGEPTFTLAQLSAHFLLSWGGVNGCLQKLHPEQLKHFDAWKQKVKTNPDAGALLSEGRALAQEGFALTTDADLSRTIPTYFAPQGEVFLATLLVNAKHVNHHAHQLFIYLKLLGLPVRTQHLYRFQS